MDVAFWLLDQVSDFLGELDLDGWPTELDNKVKFWLNTIGAEAIAETYAHKPVKTDQAIVAFLDAYQEYCNQEF